MSPPTFRNDATFHASRDVVCEFYSRWFGAAKHELEICEPSIAIAAVYRLMVEQPGDSTGVNWYAVAGATIRLAERQIQRRAA